MRCPHRFSAAAGSVGCGPSGVPCSPAEIKSPTPMVKAGMRSRPIPLKWFEPITRARSGDCRSSRVRASPRASRNRRARPRWATSCHRVFMSVVCEAPTPSSTWLIVRRPDSRRRSGSFDGSERPDPAARPRSCRIGSRRRPRARRLWAGRPWRSARRRLAGCWRRWHRTSPVWAGGVDRSGPPRPRSRPDKSVPASASASAAMSTHAAWPLGLWAPSPTSQPCSWLGLGSMSGRGFGLAHGRPRAGFPAVSVSIGEYSSSDGPRSVDPKTPQALAAFASSHRVRPRMPAASSTWAIWVARSPSSPVGDAVATSI